jgi:hypothetical protein
MDEWLARSSATFAQLEPNGPRPPTRPSTASPRNASPHRVAAAAASASSSLSSSVPRPHSAAPASSASPDSAFRAAQRHSVESPLALSMQATAKLGTGFVLTRGLPQSTPLLSRGGGGGGGSEGGRGTGSPSAAGSPSPRSPPGSAGRARPSSSGGLRVSDLVGADTHGGSVSAAAGPSPRERNMNIRPEAVDGARPRLAGREKLGLGRAAPQTHLVVGGPRRDAAAAAAATAGRSPGGGASPAGFLQQHRQQQDLQHPAFSPIRTHAGASAASVRTPGRASGVGGGAGHPPTSPPPVAPAVAHNIKYRNISVTSPAGSAPRGAAKALPIAVPAPDPPRGSGEAITVRLSTHPRPIAVPGAAAAAQSSSSTAASGSPPPASAAGIRDVIEEVRRRQNGKVLDLLGLESGIEHIRATAVAQAGTTAEQRRLQRLHAVQRQDARTRVLALAVQGEMQTMEKLKAMGVKTFAQLADAFQ